jgi:NAD(P)-dependent dehydrogenase (short-subunit alcohol dehydrogenase family)
MRLKDKVAIITGGAHGMGEAEARLFAKEGAAVVIADVLQKEGEAVAADISASQSRATFVKTDVTSEAAWDQLIATTIATYGRLDILVNNAGISGSSVGDELALAGWEKLMAVNATSVFLGTTRAAAEMAKTGGGSIINISSIMGFIGRGGQSPRLQRVEGCGAHLHQNRRRAVRTNRSAGQLRPSRLSAAHAEQYECGRTRLESRRHAVASLGRGDGCRLWRSVPRIRRGIVRDRNRIGHRWGLYRAVDHEVIEGFGPLPPSAAPCRLPRRRHTFADIEHTEIGGDFLTADHVR